MHPRGRRVKRRGSEYSGHSRWEWGCNVAETMNAPSSHPETPGKAQQNAHLPIPGSLITSMKTLLLTLAVKRNWVFWKVTSGMGVVHKTWATQKTRDWRVSTVVKRKKNLLIRMLHQCFWAENLLQHEMWADLNKKCQERSSFTVLYYNKLWPEF